MFALSLHSACDCCAVGVESVVRCCWELILFTVFLLFTTGGGYLVFTWPELLLGMGGASDMLSQSDSDSEFILTTSYPPNLYFATVGAVSAATLAYLPPPEHC